MEGLPSEVMRFHPWRYSNRGIIQIKETDDAILALVIAIVLNRDSTALLSRGNKWALKKISISDRGMKLTFNEPNSLEHLTQ